MMIRRIILMIRRIIMMIRRKIMMIRRIIMMIRRIIMMIGGRFSNGKWHQARSYAGPPIMMICI